MTAGNGTWALLVHGGAKEIEAGEEEANRSGCLEAARAGADCLADGGSAVDAVEAAIRVLERLPAFNAGYGSVLNAKGEVEMCAALMDGATLDVGAVGALMGIAHPVSVARAMLREQPVLLVGQGAHEFAREHRFEPCDGAVLAAPQKAEKDTVGAVALDMHGDIAAGTSTGGLSDAAKGRIGDSPLPGCGFYAHNQTGGVALSGHGEGIARLAAAAQIIGALDRLGPEAAVAHALAQMERVGGDAGGIAIDASGHTGWWHNSPHFAVAEATSAAPEPRTWLHKDEKNA